MSSEGLYCLVPKGRKGGYVAYPFQGLIGVNVFVDALPGGVDAGRLNAKTIVFGKDRRLVARVDIFSDSSTVSNSSQPTTTLKFAPTTNPSDVQIVSGIGQNPNWSIAYERELLYGRSVEALIVSGNKVNTMVEIGKAQRVSIEPAHFLEDGKKRELTSLGDNEAVYLIPMPSPDPFGLDNLTYGIVPEIDRELPVCGVSMSWGVNGITVTDGYGNLAQIPLESLARMRHLLIPILFAESDKWDEEISRVFPGYIEWKEDNISLDKNERRR